MISYIIPTLWKSENIFKTIDLFCKIEDPDAELIIINNDDWEYINNKDSRIKIHKTPQNIYVNPSWNLGVQLAVNNKVCLVNDDILFDIKKFHYFALDSKVAAIGINNSDRCSVDLPLYQLKEIHDRNARPPGLGQLMLIEKQNWIPLPDSMKVYYGDDIIYYYHTLILDIPFHYIKGMALNGNQSVTVNTLPPHMNNPFSQDTLEYHKMMCILGLDSCTVFPMELKRAWKFGDIDQKITFEKLMNNIINNG
jgi:hypothetical protein